MVQLCMCLFVCVPFANVYTCKTYTHSKSIAMYNLSFHRRWELSVVAKGSK